MKIDHNFSVLWELSEAIVSTFCKYMIMNNQLSKYKSLGQKSVYGK